MGLTKPPSCHRGEGGVERGGRREIMMEEGGVKKKTQPVPRAARALVTPPGAADIMPVAARGVVSAADFASVLA